MESEQINQTAPQERTDDKKDLAAESLNDIDQRHGEPRFGFLTYGTTTTIQVCVATPLIKPLKPSNSHSPIVSLLQLAIFNFGSKNIPSHLFLVITSNLNYIIRGHYFKFPQKVVISHRVVYVVYKPGLRPFPTLLVGDMLSYLGLYETTAVSY
jgi:hypothetical protein